MVVGNVTGWNELFAGNVSQAVYKVLDFSVGGSSASPGYLLVILIFSLQAMIYMRSRNLGLALITGLFLYGGLASVGLLTQFIPVQAITILIVVFVFELAGILWYTFAT